MSIALVVRTIQESADNVSATTAAVDTTGANLIVGGVRASGIAAGDLIFTDNKSNTWTALTRYTNTESGDEVQLFYCASPTVGTGHTFHGSGDNVTTCYPDVGMIAFSGASATPYGGQITGANSAGATVTSLQAGSLTPSEDNCVLVTLAGFGGGGGGSSGTIDLGFDAQVKENLGHNNPAGMAYLIETAATARNPTWSWTGASFAVATMAAFKPAVAGDTTPPTLSARTVPTGGTTLTATLSESGCVPASGTGGFTLAGTSATVASWAISGTTLTLTLSGTVYSGQTVTLTYSRASTTDDIADAAGNFLADFSAAAVTNNSTQTQPLTAGTASLVSSGPGGIAMTATDATFGTPAYTYQWQRNAGGGSYSNLANGGGVAGATTRNLTDGSAVAGTLYGYRLVYTDSAGTPATATSNAITAQVYTGGALTGSAGYSRGRLVNS
jgi:hypothetical protein